MFWAGYIFDLLVILLLVQAAKSRRAKCDWDWKKATRRFWWGVIGIAAVQIGGVVVLIDTGHSIGIRGVIQWPCIYWVALAVYRKRDLRQKK